MFANPAIRIDLPHHTGPCSVQVGNVSASVFSTGQEQHSLPVVMKRLQNITIKRSRGTFNKMSIINKMRAIVTASNKRSKADQLKTDVVVSGSTTPEILFAADGKTCLNFVLLDQGPAMLQSAQAANHCPFVMQRCTSNSIADLCTMQLHKAAS